MADETKKEEKQEEKNEEKIVETAPVVLDPETKGEAKASPPVANDQNQTQNQTQNQNIDSKASQANASDSLSTKPIAATVAPPVKEVNATKEAGGEPDKEPATLVDAQKPEKQEKPETKNKKINQMTLKEIDSAIQKTEKNMQHLKNKYGQELLKRKASLQSQ